MGIAVASVKASPATRPTTKDVVVEELCMSEVATIPTNNPMNGLDVVCINCSANPFPNNLREWPIN